jgi:KaiC/GvpD/RAD55 family RecA-like ATPase
MADEFDDPTLQDPDAEGEARYNWDEEFQRHIISLLLCDRQFLIQSLDLIKPTYFTNKVHQKTCDILFKHYIQYRSIPDKAMLIQEVKSGLADNKSLPYYVGELNVLFEYFQPGLDNREYLLDKISYFAKIQAIRKAFSQSLKKVNENPESDQTYEEVYDILRDAMAVDRNFDIGTDYFKNLEERYSRLASDDYGDVFPTGWHGVDSELKAGGYGRGELFGVCADSGVGKSISLACITAKNLMRGHNGLYISCEIDEMEIEDRLDAIITGLPIQTLVDHKNDVFDMLEGRKPVLDNGFPVFFHKEDTVGKLLIKEFPSGQLTVNMLQAYINQVKFHGYKPDFVIVDYLGEMKLMPGMKKHDSMESTARDLRGLAKMENVFMATALQPNRSAKQEQKEWGHIGQQHLADSYGVVRPMDGVVMLNQNDTESKLFIGRGWVEKNRKAKKHYYFYLVFDPRNLRIREVTHDEYGQIRSKHAGDVVAGVEKDVIHGGSTSSIDTMVSQVNKRKKGFKPKDPQDGDFERSWDESS